MQHKQNICYLCLTVPPIFFYYEQYVIGKETQNSIAQIEPVSTKFPTQLSNYPNSTSNPSWSWTSISRHHEHWFFTILLHPIIFQCQRTKIKQNHNIRLAPLTWCFSFNNSKWILSCFPKLPLLASTLIPSLDCNFSELPSHTIWLFVFSLTPPPLTNSVQNK